MVKIVTDSTCDLPPEIAQELGIVVVPLNVHFGQEVYRDGIDLTAEEFFRKLATSSTLPKTSQPSAGVFAEVYGKLEDREIISIHVSAKLSGTYNSALLGRHMLEGSQRIEVVDSLQVSMGLGLVVIAAAKAAQAGASLGEVMDIVSHATSRIKTVALLDTLEYLHKGGRIGHAQALLGTLLSVKPIIKIEDGEVHPVARVRTRPKALERLYEVVSGFPHIEEMAIMHSSSSEEVEGFLRRLAPIFPRERIYLSRFGPVIGTYTGPGAIGIAVMEGVAGHS